MKTKAEMKTVGDVLALRSTGMLFPNPEYQRGAVWTKTQKRKLVDSVLRGYPIPMMYFHLVRQEAGGLVSQRYEVIDGQQRINALSEYRDGAFTLFDPIANESEARFPDFIKQQPCPWASKAFDDLTDELKKRLLSCELQIVRVETDDANEARDLFVRLQAGMPLNSQEKRDAWPGQFTDFILKLGGKTGIDRYPGHTFFNDLMKGARVQDRGKIRQLAAQISMLYFSRLANPNSSLPDINSAAIDDFYYERLSFDPGTKEAKRLVAVLDKIAYLLKDQKRSKIVGHEAIHLVLLVDSLLDHYAPSWQDRFPKAFDVFRENFAKGKLTRGDPAPSPYWLRYGVPTRVNSDRGDSIQMRHAFFSTEMLKIMKPVAKDPNRVFGEIEREILYAQQRKRCGVCRGDVIWSEAEIHHVDEHHKGGITALENGAMVHAKCHPKGAKAVEQFAAIWPKRRVELAEPILIDLEDDDEDNAS
jgi:uncharacterized protein DUF262/HNH endonuclease